MLPLDISGELEPLVGAAQVAEHEQREPAIQPVSGLLFRTHGGEPVFGSLEDFGRFDVVPVRVQVRAALHRVAGTATQAEHHGYEYDGGKTKHCFPV